MDALLLKHGLPAPGVLELGVAAVDDDVSPGSSRAASSSITASVGLPALTMMRILRGTASEATKSSDYSDGTNAPSVPCSSISASVLA